MESEGLVHRKPPSSASSNPAPKETTTHPAGPAKHGGPKQALRMLLFGWYFLGSCICTLLGLSIHISQFIGAPLYLMNRDWYYAWMALTKQHFGLLITTMTQWWSPTVVRISGDESMRGQLRKTEDGRLETDFPERMVLIANHQIYTDWLYLWWIAYTSRMHGHLYIILKESLKYIPIIGTGMSFFSFIFLSRKWAADKPRFQHRLQKLNSLNSGPMSGNNKSLDPMWLLIFPEGTNLSINGRNASKRWAEKSGIEDMRHALLPRSTGLHFCLTELKDTVEWVYDCTVAYEGVPRGSYGQDIFTLKSTYFEGRPPKSVNMHWRRFAVSSIPIDDDKAFQAWVLARWREKDDLLEYYLVHGRFPADVDAIKSNQKVEKGELCEGYIETEVKPKYWWEVLQMFVPVLGLGLVINVVWKMVLLVKRVM